MFQVARRFLRCEQDAADAVQDAFASAFKSFAGFEGGAGLATWLHRITANAALMRVRSKSRRPAASLDGMPQFDAAGHSLRPVPEWSRDSRLRAADRELCERVHAAIDQLPESYRAVLLLRDIQERSTAEVAQALGCTIPNVKIRLHRALTRLARRARADPAARRRGMTGYRGPTLPGINITHANRRDRPFVKE